MKLKKHIVSFSAVMLIALLTAFQALLVFAYDGEIPYTSYTYWESDGFTAVSAKAAALPPSIRTSERTRASTFFIAILLCKFVILLTAAKEILCIRR